MGHPLYAEADPRAACLLELLDLPLVARRDRVVHRGRARRGGGHLRRPAQHRPGHRRAGLRHAACRSAATEAIFDIARIAGWIAHAIEEYGEAPLRFRTRALYTGPPVT